MYHECSKTIKAAIKVQASVTTEANYHISLIRDD